MVLVYGAEGLLGQDICRRLRERGTKVRALLPRNSAAQSLDTLRRMNVETFVADLNELPAVAAACSGEQTVVCADPAMLPSRNGTVLERGAIRCLVEFASALCVHEFIFVTVPERFQTACALVEARNECCARLEAHRMNYVVLDTGFLMETWLSPELGFDYRGGRATVFGDGTHPIAWVSSGDVAETAVRCLGVDHARKREVEVAGPENLSPFDVVRLFEEVSGARMDVTRIPEDDLRAEYKGARDPAKRVLAAMKLEYARGCPMNADTSEIPITLTSVREYCRRALGQGAGTVN